MTHDEETMLKGYLRLDGPGFADWLRTTRDGSDDGERKYKATLAEARAWGRGVHGRCEGVRRVGGGARGLGAGPLHTGWSA